MNTHTTCYRMQYQGKQLIFLFKCSMASPVSLAVFEKISVHDLWILYWPVINYTSFETYLLTIILSLFESMCTCTWNYHQIIQCAAIVCHVHLPHVTWYGKNRIYLIWNWIHTDRICRLYLYLPFFPFHYSCEARWAWKRPPQGRPSWQPFPEIASVSAAVCLWGHTECLRAVFQQEMGSGRLLILCVAPNIAYIWWQW